MQKVLLTHLEFMLLWPMHLFYFWNCVKRVNNECALSSRKYAVSIGLEGDSQIATAGIVIGFCVC